MPQYSLHINGKLQKVIAEPDTPLLWVLRDELGLCGTKYGCGVGVCGACTIHENGTAVRACQIAVSSAADKRFTTIEGLFSTGEHACQATWVDQDVAQCGFCQAGMIMESAALLHRRANPSDAEIDEVMSQHVCRCGTYQRIRKAIHLAANAAPEKKST
ncbi:MAG TPA: (2Fe-2S)-binding protein [Candidatus Angelobacter sp.]|jgi:isoquinoline 1-oxidoreductase alpha subunit